MTDELNVKISGNKQDGYKLSLYDGDRWLYNYWGGYFVSLPGARRGAKKFLKRARTRRDTECEEIIH